MPIVELFNHHWSGSRFNVAYKIRPGDLTVINCQPVPESNECYAFYSPMDSFDSLLRYDFIDEHTPIIHSVPLELKAPDDRKIVIRGILGAMNKGKIKEGLEDLAMYMPHMHLNEDGTILEASHLAIPIKKSPLALRRVLTVLFKKLIKETPEEASYNKWIEEAEHLILEKNTIYYKELLKDVEQTITKQGTSIILEQLTHLCELQLSKLAQYSPIVQQAA